MLTAIFTLSAGAFGSNAWLLGKVDGPGEEMHGLSQ